MKTIKVVLFGIQAPWKQEHVLEFTNWTDTNNRINDLINNATINKLGVDLMPNWITSIHEDEIIHNIQTGNTNKKVVATDYENTISSLRDEGYMILIMSPDELKGANPKKVETALMNYVWDIIDDLKDETDE